MAENNRTVGKQMNIRANADDMKRIEAIKKRKVSKLMLMQFAMLSCWKKRMPISMKSYFLIKNKFKNE